MKWLLFQCQGQGKGQSLLLLLSLSPFLFQLAHSYLIPSSTTTITINNNNNNINNINNNNVNRQGVFSSIPRRQHSASNSLASSSSSTSLFSLSPFRELGFNSNSNSNSNKCNNPRHSRHRYYSFHHQLKQSKEQQEDQKFRLYALKNNNNGGSGYDFTQLLSLARKSLKSVGKNVEGYLPVLVLVLLFSGNIGFLLNLVLFSIAVPILGVAGALFFLSSKIHVGPCPVCGQDNLGNSKSGSQVQCNYCQSIIETGINPKTKKKEFILSDIDYNNTKRNSMNDVGGFGSADPMESLLQSLFGGMNLDTDYVDTNNGKNDDDTKDVKKYGKSSSKFRKDDDVIDVVAKSVDNED